MLEQVNFIFTKNPNLIFFKGRGGGGREGLE